MILCMKEGLQLSLKRGNYIRIDDMAAEGKISVAVLFGKFYINNVLPLKTRNLISALRK